MRWKEALLQEVICMTDAAVKDWEKNVIGKGSGLGSSFPRLGQGKG